MTRTNILCTTLFAVAALAACSDGQVRAATGRDGFADGCRAGYQHNERRLSAPLAATEQELYGRDVAYRSAWDFGFDKCFTSANWPGTQ